MRSPSASELLQVWERGLNQLPIQRALSLLSTACPATPPATLAQLSLGQRDVCLLTLREWVFGPQLVSLATCPHCGDRLELTLNVADLRVAALPSIVEKPALSPPGFSPDLFSVELADYEVEFRLPNSLDLAAIANDDLVDGQQTLLNRCILAVRQQGETRSAEQLPPAVREAIAQQMAQVDPQADVQLSMNCPVCMHQWQITFDIVSFFWSEINAWAARILEDVHTLATAYGWAEADILSMSPFRRQCYLEKVSRSMR